MRAGRPPAYSISPFMRDTKLVKGIHCEVREQVFDIAIEDTPVRAFYMTMSYHYKFPRALESKFKQQTEGNFAKFVLLYLDVEDKNRQFVEVQKLALVYGYNLLPADSVEDCRDCLEELRVEFTSMSGRYNYSKQTETDKPCYYPMQYVEYTPYADYFRKESRRLRSRIEDMSKTELLTECRIETCHRTFLPPGRR